METEMEHPSLLDKLDRPPRPEPIPVAPREESTGSAKSVTNSDAQSLSDWFKQFSGNQIKITLIRVSPDEWEGYNTGGTLDHYDELIDEEFIQKKYGGGKYQVKAQQQLPNGRWQFAGARTFKIAGDPKITGSHFRKREEGESAPIIHGPGDSDVTRAALGMARDMARDAQERADRVETRAVPQNNGVSEVMLQMMLEPFKTQIITLNGQLSEKDRIIAEKDKTIKDLTEKRPDTTLQDKLIDKMYDGESARVEALRNNFESERRQLIQSHDDQVRRLQDRHDTDLRRLEDAHAREIKTFTANTEARIESLKHGYESRLEAKDNRNKDLDRDLSKANVELVELRSRKDKTMIDQMGEFAQIRETMQAVGMLPTPEAEEPESAMDKVIRVAEPLVAGIGARLQQAPQAPAPAQQRRVIRRPAPAPTGPVATATSIALAPGLDPGDVASAVAYMESAVRNGIGPDVFAQSIRNAVPQKVLSSLKEHGVDTFLDKVAKLEESSPLATQVGRTFARKVVRYLLTESTDEAPVPEEAKQ